MGSKVSSEKKEEIKEEDKTKHLGSYDFLSHYFNNSTSYQGMKSDMSSKSGEDSSKEGSQSEDSRPSMKIEDNKENNSVVPKVPTTFVWKEGGNTVYVTGSFSNWKQWFIMKKSDTNDREFTITLDLPRGHHQYKFIVDSVWKFSKDFPKMNDGNNNFNNFIDTTNIPLPVLKNEINFQKRKISLKEDEVKYILN